MSLFGCSVNVAISSTGMTQTCEVLLSDW